MLHLWREVSCDGFLFVQWLRWCMYDEIWLGRCNNVDGGFHLEYHQLVAMMTWKLSIVSLRCKIMKIDDEEGFSSSMSLCKSPMAMLDVHFRRWRKKKLVLKLCYGITPFIYMWDFWWKNDKLMSIHQSSKVNMLRRKKSNKLL